YLQAAISGTSEHTTSNDNYVVWQKAEDSGSIKQTATLPSFVGNNEPTIIALDGVEIQIPISQQEQKTGITLQEQIDTLIQQPEYSYLNQFIDKQNATWQEIVLAEDSWDYEQEGLTPAAAALISIAVGIATSGVGAGLLGTTGATTTAMANAAFSSLASQASVTLINNKGNVAQTLKDLGKSDAVKSMAQAAITAGVTASLDQIIANTTNIDISASAGFDDKLARGVIQGTGHALTESLMHGTSLEDSLKNHLTNQLVDAAAASVYQNGVKPLNNNDTQHLSNAVHKLAAGLTGCVAAKAKDESCESAAVGAIIGEMVGDWMANKHEVTMDDGEKILILSDEETQKILNTAKLTAGSVALLYGFDVDTAVGSAEEAVENNAVWAAIPATIFVLGKLYTAYQVYQDIQDLKSGKKTVEQLAREKGEDYIAQAIAGNIGKYGYKIVKSGSRRIVQAVKKTCSFHGSTLISTANGYKPISTIKIGDFVWSRDEYTGKYSYQPVTNWYHNQYQETVYVTIVDSQGNEQILISNAIHPFFAKAPYDTIVPVSSEGHDYQGEIDHGVWIDASNLQAGYQLLSEDGTWQTVKSVSIAKEALTAYNLTVDNTHTYFVSAQGGKYGVWVHNDCANNALSKFKGSKLSYGSNVITIDKAGMKHILERHHPKYWDGTKKANQTFFAKKTTVADIETIIKSVLNQNAPSLRAGVKDGQLPGTVNGVSYTLGLSKGRVGQLYPNPPK
ncbi:polymorphic toxin-type HINT domain-containing protein, partial [Moraxella porci]|uniref:polymorphic toxin-type HINT domain-containing protein n=1 Tax=Moraxella porci TaxID=1288392 RepID=UPI00244CC211